MIESNNKVYCYTILVKEIFCCDCFFDRVLFLINKINNELKEEEDDFIEILEKDFNEKEFMINFLGGIVILNCKNTLKFIRTETKKEIFLDKCVTDIVRCSEEKIEIYTVCFLDLLRQTKLFNLFSLNKEMQKNETQYL